MHSLLLPCCRFDLCYKYTWYFVFDLYLCFACSLFACYCILIIQHMQQHRNIHLVCVQTTLQSNTPAMRVGGRARPWSRTRSSARVHSKAAVPPAAGAPSATLATGGHSAYIPPRAAMRVTRALHLCASNPQQTKYNKIKIYIKSNRVYSLPAGSHDGCKTNYSLIFCSLLGNQVSQPQTPTNRRTGSRRAL